MARKTDWEIFLKKYCPIEKSEDYYLFETFGEDLLLVKNTDKNLIWTLVQGDNDKLYLIPGFHIVNRLNYVIATIPFETNSRNYLY